jgi:hypothetical protein
MGPLPSCEPYGRSDGAPTLESMSRRNPDRALWPLGAVWMRAAAGCTLGSIQMAGRGITRIARSHPVAWPRVRARRRRSAPPPDTPAAGRRRLRGSDRNVADGYAQRKKTWKSRREATRIGCQAASRSNASTHGERAHGRYADRADHDIRAQGSRALRTSHSNAGPTGIGPPTISASWLARH